MLQTSELSCSVRRRNVRQPDDVHRHARQWISLYKLAWYYSQGEVRMLRAEIKNVFGVHRYVAIRIIFH